MFNIEKFDESSYEYYEKVVEFVNKYLKMEGEYYYFAYNGKDYILCKTKNLYTVIDFYPEEKKIVLTSFDYNPVEDLMTMEYGDGHYVVRYCNNEESYIDEKGIYHGIDVFPKIYRHGENIHDGVAIYSQYNPRNQINLVMLYDHHYVPENEHQRVYEYRLTKPIRIMIRKDALRKADKQVKYGNSITYDRVEFDRDERSLLLYSSLIKKYGLGKVIEQGRDRLVNNNFVRYYKTINGKIIPGISKELCEEEMMELAKKYGFRTEVPSELVGFHNRELVDFSYFKDLALEFLELEASVKLERNKKEN
jgi:hypothetical protein